MLKIQEDGLVKFTIFEQFPDLICYQTTKLWDRVNSVSESKEQKDKLVRQFDLPFALVFQMQQVHGTQIRVIMSELNTYSQSDGLIAISVGQFLLVEVADCLPLFFYNRKTNNVGVVHAGWKGILQGIVLNFIDKWRNVGNKLENTLVAIGPHIGGCCYTVAALRVHQFANMVFAKAIFQENQDWHLDLGYIVREQLKQSGLLPENIEAPITCTSCQNEIYHSFRKDKHQVGRMIGIIGVRK